MDLVSEKIYTSADYWNSPNGQRAELIDGKLHPMAMPNRIHQELVGKLCFTIGNFIDLHVSYCEVLLSPFAVNLTGDEKTWVEPDISVICDKNKLSARACEAAPDWIIEIVSPSTQWMDYGIKLFKYHTAGVREYWIVNPATRVVNVFDFEQNENSMQYTFDEEIPVCIYENFSIRISDLI